MYCIRGATTVLHNEKEEMLKKTEILLKEMIQQNQLELQDIVSIHFTATKDLDAVYPAEAARKLGITNAALLCMQEMHVKGSLPRCIRVMLTASGKREPNHIYLEDSKSLRPDLVKPQNTFGMHAKL